MSQPELTSYDLIMTNTLEPSLQRRCRGRIDDARKYPSLADTKIGVKRWMNYVNDSEYRGDVLFDLSEQEALGGNLQVNQDANQHT